MVGLAMRCGRAGFSSPFGPGAPGRVGAPWASANPARDVGRSLCTGVDPHGSPHRPRRASDGRLCLGGGRAYLPGRCTAERGASVQCRVSRRDIVSARAGAARAFKKRVENGNDTEDRRRVCRLAQCTSSSEGKRVNPFRLRRTLFPCLQVVSVVLFFLENCGFFALFRLVSQSPNGPTARRHRLGRPVSAVYLGSTSAGVGPLDFTRYSSGH